MTALSLSRGLAIALFATGVTVTLALLLTKLDGWVETFTGGDARPSKQTDASLLSGVEAAGSAVESGAVPRLAPPSVRLLSRSEAAQLLGYLAEVAPDDEAVH